MLSRSNDGLSVDNIVERTEQETGHLVYDVIQGEKTLFSTRSAPLVHAWISGHNAEMHRIIPVEFGTGMAMQADMSGSMIVVDVETTGLDPETNAVVEIAAISLDCESIGDVSSSFVNPGRHIPPEASGIHHILDEDVVDAPTLDKIVEMMVPAHVNIVAAHNARFDRVFLPMLHDRQWIDTYRCALHVWPDAPNHKNMTLRYWLGIELPRNGAHGAVEDVIVTAHILKRLLQERTVDELVRLSTKAVVLKKVGFGKYYDRLWTDVPWEYLVWMCELGLEEFDPDVAYTVKTEIVRRSVPPD